MSKIRNGEVSVPTATSSSFQRLDADKLRHDTGTLSFYACGAGGEVVRDLRARLLPRSAPTHDAILSLDLLNNIWTSEWRMDFEVIAHT